MTIDNKEREFYQQTIASLLHYNGMLITKLFTQGQMPPIPMSAPTMFGIDLTMDPGDIKKMQSAWKDSPMNMGNLSELFNPTSQEMIDMMRKFGSVFPRTEKKDTEEDPLK